MKNSKIHFLESRFLVEWSFDFSCWVPSKKLPSCVGFSGNFGCFWLDWRFFNKPRSNLLHLLHVLVFQNEETYIQNLKIEILLVFLENGTGGTDVPFLFVDSEVIRVNKNLHFLFGLFRVVRDVVLREKELVFFEVSIIASDFSEANTGGSQWHRFLIAFSVIRVSLWSSFHFP